MMEPKGMGDREAGSLTFWKFLGRLMGIWQHKSSMVKL